MRVFGFGFFVYDILGKFISICEKRNDLSRVNEYKEKREKSLEGLAKRVAREVAATKIEVKLDSMNSYERRIIHNILTNNKRVYTESEGEEPNRYVVVKPKED